MQGTCNDAALPGMQPSGMQGTCNDAALPGMQGKKKATK
jgi:hypothetical protein